MGSKYSFFIRRMQPDDVKAVANIERECFSDAWTEGGFLESLMQEYTCWLVACDEQGRPVGYCGLYITGFEADIVNIATAPEFRRQGVAGMLLREAMEEGSLLGVRDFTLEVRAGNAPAIRLYESFGFINEGIRKNFYRNPAEDALIMWLKGYRSNKYQ